MSYAVLKSRKNDPFDLIPEDLKIEILLKLPAKSIAKLSLVSESCLSIIYGKTFTKMYMNRCLTKRAQLFIVHHHYIQKQPSDHHRVNILNSNDRYDFSEPINGLICCVSRDNSVIIGNPTTHQFVTLLKHNSWEGTIFLFLGYDHVNSVYKVLCLKVLLSLSVLSMEHHVLTLGATQKWRMIECKHPHYPTPGTKGICINGVVYYIARVDKLLSLICFNLTNEDFTVIKLRKSCPFIANYNGKVALSNVLYKGKLDLWVLEDAKKQEWSKVSIFDSSWTHLSTLDGSRHQIKFRGTLSTDKLIFSPYSSFDWFYLLRYNPKKKKFREVQIKRVGGRDAACEVFLDHIESPLFLSKVS